MQEQIPRELGKHIVVSPIPRNMTPTFHQERREARAKALIALHASDEGAVFVDAASYKNIGDAFSVSVIGAKTGEIRLAASVRTTVPSQAEEVAVALAIADPRTKTVLCDSRTAVRNFAKQRVCSAAARILRKAEVNGVITSAVIKWFPAHAGTEVAGSLGLTNHNETANSVARGLAGRAPVTAAADVVDRPEKDTMDAYNEVTLWYRLARRTMALPHPRLTREEAAVFRQLQTNSVITPVLAKHLWPEVYVTDLCRLCGKERATLAHILEDCECANADNSADVLPPLMEEAKRSEDYDVQHTAIQQILAALEKQRPDGMEAERVNPTHPSKLPQYKYRTQAPEDPTKTKSRPDQVAASKVYTRNTDFCHPRESRRRRRHYNRHSSVAAASASGYDFSPSIPGLRDINRDVVREELKKLLPSAERPASISIAEVVRDEVQRAILPDAPVTVAAPNEPTLTYAAMARRPPQAHRQVTSPPRREHPAPQYSRRQEDRAYVRPDQAPPRKTDVWRTADRRPLCFHCGEAGHIYRRCPYRQLGLRGFHPNDPRPRYDERPHDIEGYLRRSPSSTSTLRLLSLLSLSLTLGDKRRREFVRSSEQPPNSERICILLSLMLREEGTAPIAAVSFFYKTK
ncbi:hypothetical protein HPB47_014913 [Ixodes persulcatus]|uniref:Uncharacterized protein n=1 Tax=Ixodes persulcatus TaxID=34615 RepID=A0AC60QUX3_IXOPE|nr:hypothetical protein HPB47_014913 [Ixodes persulcatus]